MIDDYWWLLMLIDDYWWLLMIIDDYWWLLMIIDDYWLKTRYWWWLTNLQKYIVTSWLLTIHGYWRLLMIDNSPLLIVVSWPGMTMSPWWFSFFYVWWTRLDGKFSLIFFNENHGTTAVPIWFGIPLGGSSNPFLEGDLRRFQAFWWKIPQATGLVVMMEHFFGGKLQHMKYHLVMTNIAMV